MSHWSVSGGVADDASVRVCVFPGGLKGMQRRVSS